MPTLKIAALLMLIGSGTANAQTWPRIDCSNSRLTVPGQVKCWQGAPLHWTARAGPGKAINFQCVADHGSTLTRTSRVSGYAKYNMLQPGSDAHCVTGEGGGPLSQMQHINHVTRRGTGWSGPDRDGDRYFARFSLPNGYICRAFLAYSAPVNSPCVVN